MSRLAEPTLAQQELRPETAASVATSVTHVQGKDCQPNVSTMPTSGEGESAIPMDIKQEMEENSEDDWEHDPANPRNWSFGKKWVRDYPHTLLEQPSN